MVRPDIGRTANLGICEVIIATKILNEITFQKLFMVNLCAEGVNPTGSGYGT